MSNSITQSSGDDAAKKAVDALRNIDQEVGEGMGATVTAPIAAVNYAVRRVQGESHQSAATSAGRTIQTGKNVGGHFGGIKITGTTLLLAAVGRFAIRLLKKK